MDYIIKKSLLGKRTISFACAHCGEPLLAPFEDAGTEQPCPRCGRPFTTPGEKELNEQRAAELQKQEQEKHELVEKRKRELQELEERRRAERQQAVQATVEPPPPEMVWRGEMYCENCGYKWEARRNTPPARCPSCSKRDVVPIKRPKNLGCLILIVAFILLGAVPVVCYAVGPIFRLL